MTQNWSKFNDARLVNISPDGRKIIYKAMEIACIKLGLKIFHEIRDSIGVRGFILEDSQQRKYFLVAKRYVYASKYGPIVSINKDIVDGCVDWDFFVVMYIDDGDYVYTFDPERIAKEKIFTNSFNRQQMYNFSIKLARNMELTRTRKSEPQKSSTLGRYIRMK